MTARKSFRVASGRTDVTPSHRVPLAGFAARRAPLETIRDPLEANALLIRERDSMLCVVSLDALYVGALREIVLRELGGLIAPEQLFFAASHTHFAPATDPRLPSLGRVDGVYLKSAAEKIADLIAGLLSIDGVPASVCYREIPTPPLAINRRRKTWIWEGRFLRRPRVRVLRRPNRRAPRDNKVRVLSFHALKDNRPLTLIWNFSCHPVCYPELSSATAEYPGWVRRRIREQFNLDAVIFLQGFAGDLRPAFTRGLDLPPFRVTEFFSPTLGQWREWAERVASVTCEAVRCSGTVLDGSLHVTRHLEPVGSLLSGEAGHLSIHRWGFADQVDVIGLSAEPVAEYIDVVARLLRSRQCMPVGYIDSVFGYLPTERMLSEGGYESDQFRDYFDLKADFAQGLDDRFREVLESMLDEDLSDGIPQKKERTGGAKFLNK